MSMVVLEPSLTVIQKKKKIIIYCISRRD